MDHVAALDIASAIDSTISPTTSSSRRASISPVAEFVEASSRGPPAAATPRRDRAATVDTAAAPSRACRASGRALGRFRQSSGWIDDTHRGTRAPWPAGLRTAPANRRLLSKPWGLSSTDANRRRVAGQAGTEPWAPPRWNGACACSPMPCANRGANPYATGRRHPTIGARKITRWRTRHGRWFGLAPDSCIGPPSQRCRPSTFSIAVFSPASTMPSRYGPSGLLLRSSSEPCMRTSSAAATQTADSGSTDANHRHVGRGPADGDRDRRMIATRVASPSSEPPPLHAASNPPRANAANVSVMGRLVLAAP
jgi:hypothetical protein